MEPKPRPLRDTVFLVLALSLGWWAHGSSAPVHAAPAPDLPYQFNAIGPTSALSLYNAENKTIYVYQGATTGTSHVSCTFKYKITQPGAPIERENCPAGSLY